MAVEEPDSCGVCSLKNGPDVARILISRYNALLYLWNYKIYLMATTKTAKKKAAKTSRRKWSARVMQTSDALDLEKSIFKSDDPKKIASSLKRSAKKSHRRKGTPFQSAMSMLNFYINRAGHNLSASHKKVLEEAKDELRIAFDRPVK